MSSNLHQFLVGAASSREKKSLYSYHRGWKPLPQSKSHKLPLLNLLGSNEASFSIVNYEVWNSELCHKIRAEWVTPAVFMPRSWAALEFRSIKGPTSTFYHSGLYL